MLGDHGTVASTPWETGLGNQLHVRNGYTPGPKAGKFASRVAQLDASNDALARVLRVSSALVHAQRALFRCWSLGGAMKVRR
jgi:hypothetical protein